MRATQRLREKLKTEVPHALSAALNAPLPRAVLQSRAAQRSAQRLLWVLDRVPSDRFAAKPIAVLRHELRKLAGPEAERADHAPHSGSGAEGESAVRGRPDRTTTAAAAALPDTPSVASAEGSGAERATRASIDRPMPEMIRTTGGRRVPGSVAHQAVAHSGTEFKPKKGKK